MAGPITSSSSTAKPLGVLEAKAEGTILSNVEPQRDDYAEGMPDDLEVPIEPLPFTYMSTGAETRFKNGLDPDARTRDVFAFHRPETLAAGSATYFDEHEAPTLRHRLQLLPELDTTGLWPAQVEAIRNLEVSLAESRPRALIQMATGSGKTYTAANVAYRLIKLRRRDADPLPRRPREPRAADAEGVPGLHDPGRRAASSPSSTTSSTSPRTRSTRSRESRSRRSSGSTRR